MHSYFYSIASAAAFPVLQMDGVAGGLQAIIVKLDNQITDTVHKFILLNPPLYVTDLRADSLRHRTALSMVTSEILHPVDCHLISALSSFAGRSSRVGGSVRWVLVVDK